MTTLEKVRRGLEILEKTGGDICAEHDIIYAGAADAVLDEDDVFALRELGWHVDSESGGWARYV